MKLDAKELCQFLRSKGVRYLYHVNTVKTSCSFLHERQLMARGIVLSRQLPQTPQGSDDKDKQLGLWYDLFFDVVDIHEHRLARNFYGPVLFKFKLALLEHLPDGKILRITKRNPVYWSRTDKLGLNYFSSLDELRKEVTIVGDCAKMLVVKNINGVIPLDSHLEEIVVDDPGEKGKFDTQFFGCAVGALKAAAYLGGLGKAIKIKKRECKTACKCKTDYRTAGESILRRLFSFPNDYPP